MVTSPSSAPRACIDVVIPAYNAEPYLRQALESVLIQGPIVGQLIVVNDGSSDGTAQCVLDFQIAHPELSLQLINQSNCGLAAARNVGITRAQAPFIALLDADDVWLPEKLQLQWDCFSRSTDTQLGLVYGGYELISSTGQNLTTERGIVKPSLRGSAHAQLLRGNFISGSGSNVLIKKLVFERVGLFDETLQASEDWDMWLRISKEFHVDFVAAPLVEIRVHAHNMQKDYRRMLEADFMVLNKLDRANESSVFLLWKIRTQLLESKIDPRSLAAFALCSSHLQAKFIGLQLILWRYFAIAPIALWKGLFRLKQLLK